MALPQFKAASVIACLVLVGTIAGLWFKLRPATPKIDRTPIIAVNTGIGEVLAEETVKAMHDKGNVVLVNGYDPKRLSRSSDDSWTAFHHELQKHSAIHIIATEIVPPDATDGPLPGCSHKAFIALVDKYAQADAFVFFIALPEWLRVEPLLTKPVTAKIIAIDANRLSLQREHYAGYFNSGILTALIGLRNGTGAKPAPQPQPPREWFNQAYQIYTPENYESLFADYDLNQPGAPRVPHP